VYGGLGQPSNNFVAPTSPFYTPLPNYPYDPVAAHKLLVQAGYPHGFSLTIEQLQGYPTLNQEAVIWQAGLQKAGIQASLRMNEINAWIDRFGKSNYQATMDVDVQGPDPNRFFLISLDYHYSQKDYLNKKLIDLGIAADSTLNVAKRKALYGQLQQQALQDLPVLPLYRAPLLAVARTSAHGFVFNGKGFLSFARASITG
jgi:ABC-type transport system substrate-binding protein